jgi:branched-chain amino acid transport system ATP-binding protein
MTTPSDTLPTGSPPSSRISASSAAMLEVRDLEVRYGGVQAVRGISFDVLPDTSVALVGPNGAGKTSTLEGLGGFVKTSRGAVRIAGSPVRPLRPRGRIELGLSLVPEGWNVLTELSVEDNLRLFGDAAPPAAAERAWPLERVYELFAPLWGRRELAAGLLSGGERQMLSIGCALRQGPRCLMLDEPTVGLSPAMAETVWEVCETLRGEGIALLIVAQEVERVLELVDHVLVMQSGQLTLDAPRDAETVARCHDLLGFGRS